MLCHIEIHFLTSKESICYCLFTKNGCLVTGVQACNWPGRGGSGSVLSKLLTFEEEGRQGKSQFMNPDQFVPLRNIYCEFPINKSTHFLSNLHIRVKLFILQHIFGGAVGTCFPNLASLIPENTDKLFFIRSHFISKKRTHQPQPHSGGK